MTNQKTLDGKEAIQTNLLKRKGFGEVCADENFYTGDFDAYREEQQSKIKKFFNEQERYPLDARGYARLPGPCGSTHLVKRGEKKLPNCLRFVKCHRCHRMIDTKKEIVMSYSGGNQTLGLQRLLHTYCWDCYVKVKRASKSKLAGLSGREFASVATSIIQDRRKEESWLLNT